MLVSHIKLAHIIHQNVKIGVIGNRIHYEEAEALGIPAYNLAMLQHGKECHQEVDKIPPPFHRIFLCHLPGQLCFRSRLTSSQQGIE